MNEPSSNSRPSKLHTLQAASYVAVLLAATWWLLQQWAGVLRPLLLAVFLAYVLLPWYSRLRRAGLPAAVVIVALAGLVAVVLLSIAQIAASSSRDLQKELPSLQARLQDLSSGGVHWIKHRAPWLPIHGDGGASEQIQSLVGSAASMTFNAVVEALTVVLYLLFLMLGAETLPGRVRRAYPGERGDRILHVAGNINSAIISYLRAKFISSFILAVGAGIVLMCFGVKFVAVWMLLTFLCNFIPYVGSVISFTLPMAYATLQLSPPWSDPIAVAILLLGVQVASATLIEPMLIGKAVGLSPLLVLAALAVWGSIWGLPGMFLAVPLTVMLIIILKNIEVTKSFAMLTEQ